MVILRIIRHYFSLIAMVFVLWKIYDYYGSRYITQSEPSGPSDEMHKQYDIDYPLVEYSKKYGFHISNENEMGNYFNEEEITRYGHKTSDIIIVTVLCGENLNQTVVCLKSVVAASKKSLHFIIVVDDANKDKLKKELLEWPQTVLNRLSFDIYPLNFPDGPSGKEWKTLFKLCAAQRLFLPSLLPNVDSVLYIDTDVISIKPVEKIWHYFSKFNASQIAAMSPEHEEFATGWYNRFARHPYYEPLGLNSGVMLMNLTRMRTFQWESYLPSIMKEYKANIVWGDQDVINIIFHYHSDKLFIIPCDWNYRPDHCMYSSICKTAHRNGVGFIHGNRGVFHNSRQPGFKTVYDHMLQFSLLDDVKSGFLKPLLVALRGGRTNCESHLFNILSLK